jgi:hypothetical protein
VLDFAQSGCAPLLGAKFDRCSEMESRGCKSGLKSWARQGQVRILESYAPNPWFEASPDEILRELHFAFVPQTAVRTASSDVDAT